MSATEGYGRAERELAFKLLAVHAICDDYFPAFYDLLTSDPAAAAEQLHIKLTDEDVQYIVTTVAGGENGIARDTIRDHALEIRERLHLEEVTNSW